MSAGCSALTRKPKEGSSTCIPGSPEGIVPITDTSFSHRTLRTVPVTSATSRPGRYFDKRRGQSTATANATHARPNALGFRFANPSGNARRTPRGPPLTWGAPRKGMACVNMMMSPTPDMNPEITTYGV